MLSLHDALPICEGRVEQAQRMRETQLLDQPDLVPPAQSDAARGPLADSVEGEDRGLVEGRREERSEEHTSELQSLRHLVCRLLLEKKKRTRAPPRGRRRRTRPSPRPQRRRDSRSYTWTPQSPARRHYIWATK